MELCCDWAGVDCIFPTHDSALYMTGSPWRTFNDFGGAIIKWVIPQCCGNVGALFNSPWLQLFLLANFHIAHSSSLSSNPTKNLKALGFEILLLQIQRGQLIHHFVLSNCNFGGWICVWYCLVVICELPLCKTHTGQGWCFFNIQRTGWWFRVLGSLTSSSDFVIWRTVLWVKLGFMRTAWSTGHIPNPYSLVLWTLVCIFNPVLELGCWNFSIIRQVIPMGWSGTEWFSFSSLILSTLHQSVILLIVWVGIWVPRMGQWYCDCSLLLLFCGSSTIARPSSHTVHNIWNIWKLKLSRKLWIRISGLPCILGMLCNMVYFKI